MTAIQHRIKLVTCVGVEHDAALLPHFLDHYITGLGIHCDDIIILLNAAAADSPSLERARRCLQERGVTSVEEWIGPYTSASMWEKRREMQGRWVESEDWVISADVDELHEYPAEIAGFLKRCEEKGVDAVQGVFIDRLAKDGELRPVSEDPAIWEQFPVEADVICSVGRSGRHHGRMGTVKVMAFRGYLQPSMGGHRLMEDERRPRYYLGTNIGRLWNITQPRVRFALPLKVHHFKWTATMLQSIEARLRTPGASVAGSEYGRKIAAYCRQHGRIRLEDVAIRGKGDRGDSRLQKPWWWHIAIGTITNPFRRLEYRTKLALRAGLSRLVSN